MADRRIRLLFLERDYFLLREGLRDLRNIVANVETHYGRILGGEEILRLDPEVRQRVKIHLIDDVGEAFRLALLPAKDSEQTRLRSFRRRYARKAKKARQRGKRDGETT